MAPKLLHYFRKLLRSGWRSRIHYGSSLTRRRKSACVLKSVSSKSSLSGTSINSSEPLPHTCSMDSINFEFRTADDEEPDLCCARKCCKKCFCEEGEALAVNLRKSQMGIRRWKKLCRDCNDAVVCAKKKCYCADSEEQSCCKKCCCPTSIDSACDLTPASSSEELSGQFRSLSVGVRDFISLQAAVALSDEDCDSLTPKYENVPSTEEETLPDFETTHAPVHVGVKDVLWSIEESPYDFVPPRTPRAVTEPKYENVLNINCLDECVFKEISALMVSTNSHIKVVESLQELHKNYSCVPRNSSADNEIHYFYEDYEELENELNTQFETRLSD